MSGGWESVGEIIARLRGAEEEAETRESLSPEWASAEEAQQARAKADQLRAEAEAAREQESGARTVDELVAADVERERAEEEARRYALPPSTLSPPWRERA